MMRLTPSYETRDAFFSYLEELFALSSDDLFAMIKDFYWDMSGGLSGGPSSLKMLPSFVDKPKGAEEGSFLALDLGGTHFRVLAVALDGKGKATVRHSSQFKVPRKVMQGTGAALFDFLAVCIDSFLTKNRFQRNRTYDLAFTFSFPVRQTRVDSGVLIGWTKGFTATDVQGKDVVCLLNDALRRKHIDCIRVTALANDTVGTLVARSYKDPTCNLGVILGTGTNACYREKWSNIPKLKRPKHPGHMIINMEWGDFSRVRSSCYDSELDAASVNPGAMRFEKMVSGMYLGELTRRVLVDAIKRRVIFIISPDAVQRFKRKGTLKTADMSLIEGDDTADLDHIDSFLKQKGILSTFDDRTLLKRLCGFISGRAAGLGATAIAAVITWMDPDLKKVHTVGIDGALFEKYTGFSTKMRSVLDELLGGKADNISWVHSKDGSGKGAAIIAAVAAASE